MKKINAHIIFVAALLALSLYFFNSILHKGTIPNNIHYINDLTFVSYNAKQTLQNNELPLWTPYFYSGHPLIAVPENYMFDLNFLFVYLLKDIYLAMNLALIFYFFLAGFGMYLLVFNLFGNKTAGFVSSIIFMFNGFMHSFILQGHLVILEGYALIPFIFLFAHKALKTKEWVFYSALAGLFFALQILSGSMILFFYTALIVFFYLAFNLISKNFTNVLLKSIFVGAVIVAVALGIAAIKLLPVLEFTKLSNRAVNVSYAEFLGHPISFKDIARILITDIGFGDISAAIGIIGIIFLAYSFSEYKKRIVIFSLILIIFSLLFASATPVADLMYKIPGFGKQRHVERALVLFVFAGSVLAAYGFVLMSEKLKNKNYANLFSAGVVSLILLELLFLHHMPSSTKVIGPNDIELLEHISKDKTIFRTMNLAQKDLIGAAGYNYYAQKGISEVKGGGGIWVNDYVNFVAVAQQSLSSNILGILNVKYLVSDARLEAGDINFVKQFKPCQECAVWNAFGPYLYKNEGFLPRYSVVPNSVLVVGDNLMARQLVYSLMLQSLNPKNTILIGGTKIDDYGIDFLKKFKAIILVKDSIDQNSIGKLRDYAAQGGILLPDILNGKNTISNEDINGIFSNMTGTYNEIKINKYSNNRVILGLDGEKGWLAASERFAYFPGWEASINGKAVEILKADNAISALYLNGETGDLAFEYKPDSYKKGKLISLAAVIVIIIYLCYKIYRKNPKQGGPNKA